jgi:hypothetical protein
VGGGVHWEYQAQCCMMTPEHNQTAVDDDSMCIRSSSKQLQTVRILDMLACHVRLNFVLSLNFIRQVAHTSFTLIYVCCRPCCVHLAGGHE